MRYDIQKLIDALERNNFAVSVAETKDEAYKMANAFVDKGCTVGFGGSVTLEEIGLIDGLRQRDDITLFDRTKGRTHKEITDLMHKARAADVYFSSTNAISMDGKLINVDGRGNRVSAFAWGPKKVVIVAGENKTVEDVPAGLERIRNIAAPKNCVRLNRNTPCVQTGKCMDCDSPDRICRTTVVTDKPFDGFMHVILVKEELGY